MTGVAVAVAVALGAALAVTACPPSSEKKAPPVAPTACARVGETCEVSPGKLGSCVQRDDCATSAGCFVCQSQH